MENKKAKHIPQRMCTACRQMINKPELIRMVTDGDNILIDTNHKMCGRGAYICKKEECILFAQKKKALQRAFKSNISDDFYKELIEYAHR